MLLAFFWLINSMLGSLHNYRRCIKDWCFPDRAELPFGGKLVAGVLAGWTVSFVAAPIEHVKARLQVQYDASTKLYTGPINCAATLIKQKGIFHGLYKGLFSTMVFRTNFLFWWGSYDIFNNYFEKETSMNKVVANFWAGGLSATVFWITAYPVDVVKQRIMTDDLMNPKYKSWLDAFKNVYQTYGWKGYFRGFGPSILRSFPANASALAAFELVMRMFNHS